jgi:quercetin dioxygenase-like cupin family protein
MKLHLGSRTWLVVAWIVGALLSGPAAVAAVWLLAAAGFVVLPDGAPRFSGPQGREADFTEILATGDQTGGTLGMFRQTIAPKSGPPTHIHPTQHETYDVLEGEAEFVLDGRKQIVKQGEKIEIPPGTPHTFVNCTDNWLKMRDTHQPALTFEEMMRELHGLVHSGKIRGFGDLKSLVYLSMLWVKHQELQRSIQPPFFVMRCMSVVGKLIGYKI